MTVAVNKAGLEVPKAGSPAVKRAVGRKTSPVNAVSSNDDSTSESSSSSSFYIDFSFTRVAEEATIVYAGLQKTSGDTHRYLHSMLDLGNPHVLFSHILHQALKVDTLPEDLQNSAGLVHDHCVICVKSSRPVPRLRVALPSVHQPGVCASMYYGDIHHPSRGKAFRVLIMADDFSGRVYASILDDASVTG
jgi:hypothetical protein